MRAAAATARALLRPLAMLALALALGACSRQVLYSELDEREANEIVAALYGAGLDVDKVALKDGSFRVDIAPSSFSPAIGVLQQHGLPRERFESLGEVFDKDGFVSSPLEERARLNYALSQEIAQTISNIDGVIVARVHLAAPDRATLLEKAHPASASVFVKHRHDVDLHASVGKIKSMVVTGLENVPYENVTVGLFPAEPPSEPRTDTGVPPAVARASVLPVPPSSLWTVPAALAAVAGLWLVARGRREGTVARMPGTAGARTDAPVRVVPVADPSIVAVRTVALPDGIRSGATDPAPAPFPDSGAGEARVAAGASRAPVAPSAGGPAVRLRQARPRRIGPRPPGPASRGAGS